MVDLDPKHQMRTMREIEAEAPDENVQRKKKVRLFRRTSYVLFLIFVAIVVYLILSIRQPEIERPNLHIVDLPEWEAELELESDPIIVDIRDAYKYEASRVPGAIWGERDRCHTYGVDLCDESLCDARRNWYFYSDHGEEYHEIISAINVTYARQCWATVYMLEGGFKIWEAAGNEIDSEPVTVEE